MNSNKGKVINAYDDKDDKKITAIGMKTLYANIGYTAKKVAMSDTEGTQLLRTLGVNTLQEDANFLLLSILEAIDKETSEENSIINELNLSYKDIIKCPKSDDHISPQSYLTPSIQISLPIRVDNTLQKQIDSYLDGEKAADDDGYYCEKCKKKVKVTRGKEIYLNPNVLIIQLDRFFWNYRARTRYKRDCKIEYSDILKLKTKDGKKQYKLRSVINHNGSLDGGHYTAIVYNDDNNWYSVDDEIVTKFVEKSTEFNEKVKEENYKKDVYILMYELDKRE